jgi:hypothetical protein
VNLAALLGVSPAEVLNVKSATEGVARDLSAIRRALEAAVGVPNDDLVPPLRARVPYIEVVRWDPDLSLLVDQDEWTTTGDVVVPIELSPNEGRRKRVDLELATGSASMHGTITNLGEATVLARYLGQRDEWSRYAELPPGATIEHLWATRAIELVSLGHKAGKVQVIAR